MYYSNATDLFLAMHAAIKRGNVRRTSSDSASPNRESTIEATPGQTFELRSPIYNVPKCRNVDLRWAVANVLHFFAGTEQATELRKYNRHADKFLTKYRDVEYLWHGAYGAKAMPQIGACCRMLCNSPNTRRAVVSMGGCEIQDVNNPSCWSYLHFLRSNSVLDLVVYQRSLSLFGVMPYDCVLFSNIMRFVSKHTNTPMGSLHWCVGSLHCKESDALSEGRPESVLLPLDVLTNSAACLQALADPRSVNMGRYSEWLFSEEVKS